MSNLFTTIRFFLALLTVVLIAGKPYIPPKTLALLPSLQTDTSLYGPGLPDSESVIQWLDETQNLWRCDFHERLRGTPCGFNAHWRAVPEERCESTTATSSTPDVGCEPIRQRLFREDLSGNPSPGEQVLLDARGYKGLRLRIHYEGRAPYLRLYLQNRNPAYRENRDTTVLKFMSTLLPTDELQAGTVYVDFNRFNVDEWWISDYDVPRRYALPAFGHIASIGLDPANHGVHRVRVDAIELVGERISTLHYLLLIAGFWVAYLCLEGAVRYRHLHQTRALQRQQLHQLSESAGQLEKQRIQLEMRSTTDPLTGLCNRLGVQKRLQARFGGTTLPQGTVLAVLDIDHFKTLNDTYGHAMGDSVLCELAERLQRQVRDSDVVARWGGEEFVVVIGSISSVDLTPMAEHLRQSVADRLFEGGLRVTISVGVARARVQEPFDSLFKRADDALYRAKEQRNRVVWADD